MARRAAITRVKVSDVTLPVAERYAALQHADCARDPDAWGPVLRDIAASASEERLRALAIIKLRGVPEWHEAPGVLMKQAALSTNPVRVRILAVEGLAVLNSQSASNVLAALSEDGNEAQPIRIAALVALKRLDMPQCERTLRTLREEEPGFHSMVAQILDRTPGGRQRKQLQKEEEETIVQQLGSSTGTESLRLYQRLADGTRRETVESLIKRFPAETDRNKAEIALTLVKVASHRPELEARVVSYLESRVAEEPSADLQMAIRKAIDYLHAGADG